MNPGGRKPTEPRRPPPTAPSPKPSRLASVLERNIHALKRRRERAEASASFQERVADAITRFSGSLPFVYLHVALFGSWILINVGLIPFLPRFDPSFVVLAMVASVEAIFLSTFVLISQNRMSATADKRAELDLQVGLLAEHEITKLVTLVSEIAERVGVRSAVGKELEELERDVAPEAVLDEIEGAVAGAISPRSEKSAVPHPTLMAQDRASAALPLRGV